MGKMLLSVFVGLVVMVAGMSTSFAHHAGGVEIGDLSTGSVAGTPFTQLEVDQELYAIEIGETNVWYPPATIIDFKARTGRPVVFKVTNKSTAEHGFLLTAQESFGAPSALKAQLVLKSGETKYIGIPTSDFLYSTQSVTLIYKCHLHPAHVGGKLLMIR
ncbi:MAG: hypothetical protein HZA21_05880 [Nitrospirae bacterium]|nr:hypothetical protein [Nitrospirota bacterium]